MMAQNNFPGKPQAESDTDTQNQTPKVYDQLKLGYGRIIQLFTKHILRIIFVASITLSPLIIRPLFLWNILTSDQQDIISQDEISKTKEVIIQEIKNLDKKLAAFTPKSYYLIINTASNEFVLYKGNQIIKKDRCSTGSYILLKNGNEQQWMFNTPKGEFRIQGKTTSPVWRKPDWAFIEEGLPVPTANHHSRFEYGVLGDYALDLGHGYLIHGTLYQRFLGLPVTHGCVRLNDGNLELVYRSLPVGSRVYIY